MPRKKAVPPAETEEAKTVNPAAESLEEPSAPPAPPDAPEKAGGTETLQAVPEGRRAEVCSPKGLNLREGPAMSYEALEVLPEGTEVTALDLPRGVTVPGWELVDTGERTGWCSARFLRPLEG